MKIEENRIVYEENGIEIGEVEFKAIDENTVDIYHTYVDHWIEKHPEYSDQCV